MSEFVEFDCECKSCKGTGLYIGFGERDGAAVVCSRCKGTGCQHVHIEYEPFTERREREGVLRVFQTNPGICVGEGPEHRLIDFGGIPFADWEAGVPFPRGSEMRRFTCPAWWTQCAGNKWTRDECGFGMFSSCTLFGRKDECWTQYDKEPTP